jgi:hypothetical protein
MDTSNDVAPEAAAANTGGGSVVRSTHSVCAVSAPKKREREAAQEPEQSAKGEDSASRKETADEAQPAKRARVAAPPVAPVAPVESPRRSPRLHQSQAVVSHF